MIIMVLSKKKKIYDIIFFFLYFIPSYFISESILRGVLELKLQTNVDMSHHMTVCDNHTLIQRDYNILTLRVLSSII